MLPNRCWTQKWDEVLPESCRCGPEEQAQVEAEGTAVAVPFDGASVHFALD